MRKVKKSKPLVVCNVCGAFSSERQDINHRCTKAVYGRRCSGSFKSSLGMSWDECLSCAATGTLGTETCVECSGWGWRLVG